MTFYTIVAYKEAGYDSRYHEFYQSGFELSFFETPTEAVNEILRLMKLRYEGPEANDYEWEWKLLIDGKDEDWAANENQYLSNEQHNPLFYKDNPYIRITEDANHLFKVWKDCEEDRKAEEKRKAEAKKKREEAAFLASKVKNEKRLLKELQEKYPNG